MLQDSSTYRRFGLASLFYYQSYRLLILGLVCLLVFYIVLISTEEIIYFYNKELCFEISFGFFEVTLLLFMLAAWTGSINFAKILGLILISRLFLLIIRVDNQTVHVLHRQLTTRYLVLYPNQEVSLHWVLMESVSSALLDALYVFVMHILRTCFGSIVYNLIYVLFSPFKLHQQSHLWLGGCQTHQQ